MQKPAFPFATSPRQRAGDRVLFGLIVIAAGALALLDGMQAFGLPALRTLWPLVVVLFGMARLVRPAHAGSWLSGLSMIAVGLALTGQNLGLFHLSLRQWAPVLMMLGGLALVLRGLSSGARH